MATYQEFLTAYREYLSFAQDPKAKISAIPHPRQSDVMMPFFDADGRPYKENLEATRMAVSLVSELPETRDALLILMHSVRQIAAARATHSPGDVPDHLFPTLFAAHDVFVSAARRELGLPERSGSA